VLRALEFVGTVAVADGDGERIAAGFPDKFDGFPGLVYGRWWNARRLPRLRRIARRRDDRARIRLNNYVVAYSTTSW